LGEKWVFYRFLVSTCGCFTDLSTNAYGIISFHWGEKIGILPIFTDLSTNVHGIISFYWGKMDIFSIFQ
jgi:hypothetical protein